VVRPSERSGGRIFFGFGVPCTSPVPGIGPPTPGTLMSPAATRVAEALAEVL